MPQRLTPVPNDPTITINKDRLSMYWEAWFQDLFDTVRAVGNSGTTAQRPVAKLYVGMPYFDTTLGRPVWIQSLNPTVWIKADGTVV